MMTEVQRLNTLYGKVYHESPMFIVSSPGRINLIGEHIDHQNFSVLPVNIQYSIQVAVGASIPRNEGPKLEIRHVDSKSYPPISFRSFGALHMVPTDSPASWSNYVIAALIGLTEYHVCGKDQSKIGNFLSSQSPLVSSLFVDNMNQILANKAFHVLVDGQIPVNAGLASSSALTVASCTSFFFTIQHLIASDALNLPLRNIWSHLSRIQLAEITARSECYCGTASGGMDQASVLLGEKNHASHINFAPLRVQHVNLPANATFVVCNSRASAPKALHAPTKYNKRVFELKIAAYCMLKKYYEISNQDSTIDKHANLTLKHVSQKLDSLQDALSLAHASIPRGSLTKAQIETIVDKEFIEFVLENHVGHAVWEQNEQFHPLDRTIHVFEEALRVERFISLCNNDSSTSQLESLGQVMNESHDSLMGLFDCGVQDLIRLVAFIKETKAYGTRVTGAGWGGCTISLIDKSYVSEFIKIMAEYYQQKFPDTQISSRLSEYVFEVVPSSPVTVWFGSTLSKLTW